MKVNFVTNTDGEGLWSDRVAQVNIHEIDMPYVSDDGEFGELCAYFKKTNWLTQEDGLIYTDEQWIEEFRANLVKLGFSQAAADDVEYSEQGMQGEDYVSMDVNEVFIKEYEKLVTVLKS